MTAAGSGVQYTMKTLSGEEWKSFKEEQGKLEPKGIQSLPYVTKPDGSLMAETCDVMKYLAELGGDAFVIDDATYKLAERANAPPFSLADPYLNLPDPVREQFGYATPPEQVLADLVEGFKTVAGELGDKNFFAGEKPGYGEVYIFHNINNALTWKGAELEAAVGEEAMKPLKAFHDRFSELPGIKEYLAARPKECGMCGTCEETPGVPQPIPSECSKKVPPPPPATPENIAAHEAALEKDLDPDQPLGINAETKDAMKENEAYLKDGTFGR